MTLPVAILAGGLATRLRPITERIPKILIDVAGQPFAVHQIDLLRRQGLTDIVLCVGHLGEQVEQALGDGRRWGVRLRYVFDGPVLLGTGGALRKALPILGEAFFIMYGDSYLTCDFAAVEQAFRSSGQPGLMTVFRNDDAWDRSNVVYANGRIMRYDKRNRTIDMRYIDYGLGVLQAGAFDAYPADTPLDLAVIYQDLLAAEQLAGFEVAERFYEIGSPKGLEETRQYLTIQRTT
jgi:N-acetyl-alpha-D-muramate 1-phosphate uridylyltransferase